MCGFSRSNRRQSWIGARILELVRKISIQRSMETCWTQNIYAKHSDDSDEWYILAKSFGRLFCCFLLLCIRFRSLEKLARKRWCVPTWSPCRQFKCDDECVWVRARLYHGIHMEPSFWRRNRILSFCTAFRNWCRKEKSIEYWHSRFKFCRDRFSRCLAPCLGRLIYSVKQLNRTPGSTGVFVCSAKII